MRSLFDVGISTTSAVFRSVSPRSRNLPSGAYWKLRWNEAEAYLRLGKRLEARAAFSAINFDDKVHVDIRKRAKRAVKSLDEAPPPQDFGQQS